MTLCCDHHLIRTPFSLTLNVHALALNAARSRLAARARQQQTYTVVSISVVQPHGGRCYGRAGSCRRSC